MDFNEAIRWWYARVDFERKPVAPDELKLDRIRELMRRLGDPHRRLLIVHVAGSKGKGSTSAMIAAIGQAAGQRVGLFTSPHLSHVGERIQINFIPISDTVLTQRLNEIRPAADSLEAEGKPVTFFEVATALAYYHFERERVDLAVMEVGLGGRFDATNVCVPRVSVITSISYDHTAILGDRLSQIAFEKSGIIKPGIPVVSGVREPEAADEIRRIASERGCRTYVLGRDFDVKYQPGRVENGRIMKRSLYTLVEHGRASEAYIVNLLGAHQSANAVLATKVGQILNLPDDAARQGLANVCWPARMEVFAGPPTTVLDCAHNRASAQTVVETLAESFAQGSRVLVFGVSNDKDIGGILTELLPHFDHIVVTNYRSIPRAVPANDLAAMVKAVDPHMAFTIVGEPIAALRRAQELGADMVVVAGSVFLVGEIRPALC